MSVIDTDGRLIYCNDRAAEIFRPDGETPADLIGRNVRELAPAEYVEDRMSVLLQIASDGIPRVLRTVWKGRQLVSWVHAISLGAHSDSSEPESVHLVAISRFVIGEVDESLAGETYELNESKVVDLGPLSVLSPRELEVLALLGGGLRTPDIAERLHRSVSTIENHRHAIGRKLGVTDRAGLIDLARRAGLSVSDAVRPQIVTEFKAAPSDNDPVEAEPVEHIWTAMTSDPNVGVFTFALDGRLLYCNQQAVRIVRGDESTETPADFIGRNFSEWNPDAYVRDRLGLMQRVASDGRPRVMRSIWRGRQYYTWVSFLPADSESSDADARIDRVLFSVRRLEGVLSQDDTQGCDAEYVESHTADLGPLRVLSPREIEVLALIGQGLSVQNIADALGRSVKTIEKHRTSIGRKLGGATRPELILAARHAGLLMRDRDVERIVAVDPPDTP